MSQVQSKRIPKSKNMKKTAKKSNKIIIVGSIPTSDEKSKVVGSTPISEVKKGETNNTKYRNSKE